MLFWDFIFMAIFAAAVGNNTVMFKRQSFFPLILSGRYIVLHFTFRYIIYLKLHGQSNNPELYIVSHSITMVSFLETGYCTLLICFWILYFFINRYFLFLHCINYCYFISDRNYFLVSILYSYFTYLF